jgi:NADH dehydrogenase
MASYLGRQLTARKSAGKHRSFQYRDFGSLISLSRFSTIGNLMGNLVRGTVFIEGWFARLAYLSLYRSHQAVLFGRTATFLIVLADWIYKSTRADVKLH